MSSYVSGSGRWSGDSLFAEFSYTRLTANLEFFVSHLRSWRNNFTICDYEYAAVFVVNEAVQVTVTKHIADIRISETKAWHISSTLIGQIQNAPHLLDKF